MLALPTAQVSRPGDLRCICTASQILAGSSRMLVPAGTLHLIRPKTKSYL